MSIQSRFTKSDRQEARGLEQVLKATAQFLMGPGIKLPRPGFKKLQRISELGTYYCAQTKEGTYLLYRLKPERGLGFWRELMQQRNTEDLEVAIQVAQEILSKRWKPSQAA